MKKSLFIVATLFIAVIMTACYDDYKTDYGHTAVYFSYQYPVRTLIAEQDMDNFEFEVGVTYGGRYSYDGHSELVQFEITDTLITNDSTFVEMGIQVMPESWYTLSNESEIFIVNSNVGSINVTVNKDSLTSHPDATQNTYAIPFKLTGTSMDSILENRDYSIVVVKFKNEFDGRYYVKGVDYTLDANGEIVDTMIYSNPSLVLNDYIFLNSISKNEVTVPRIGSNEEADKFICKMKIRLSDGSAILSAYPESVVENLVGAATYDYENESFYANYNYVYNGIEHSVKDTLIYSNTELTLEEWN